MSPDQMQILGNVLSSFLTGAFILALVAWRKQKKQEPIDAETAAVVNARSAGEMALAVAREQQNIAKEFRTELEALRVQQQQTITKVITLESRLTGIIGWVRDLHIRWDHYRTQPHPPGGLPPEVLL